VLDAAGMWLAAVLLSGLAGIAIAAWAHQRPSAYRGGVLQPHRLPVWPSSWTHYWVWVVPLLATLTATVWRRRSPSYGLDAAVATVFAGLIPMP
jgi:alpha-1,2-mannosyltransferase